MEKQVKCPICGRLASRGLVEKYEKVIAERNTLLMSNRLLEEELKRMRETNSHLSAISRTLKRAIHALKSRSLIERIFNKEV